MADSFNVVVIGSGPGGYAAAIRAAQKGASVAVVEKSYFGGTCLNCGCIPSKTLLASAHILLMIKHASMMGINVADASPDWAKIQSRKDGIVTGFRKGLTGLVKSNKVRIFEGKGLVTAPNQIKIESDTETTQMQADKIILATGSRSSQIPAAKIDGRTVLSSKEALELQQIPASMVIVGGGIIGCEMACLYAAMGTRVTIVEALSRLIPMEDEWVGRLTEREFKKLGIVAITGQKVTAVDTSVTPAIVVLENGQTMDADKILVAVGRRAVVDDQTVQALNLKMNGPAVSVNEKMETSAPGVYAIGDAVGTTYLAHGAFAEAEVAVANAAGGDEKIGDYSLIPRAVYTFPEIASVGKTEETCSEQGIEISVGRSFFRANGRSAAHNETAGEIRAVRDKSTDKIIGVTIVGATATEMIDTARTLIGTSEKITDISFPHPTVSEVLKEAAEDAFGLSLHNPPKP
jgi:dihydrolipoamide dehydrogenase